MPNIDIDGLKDLNTDMKSLSKINCTVKEKEACLGVYSDENESRGTEIESFTTESAAREVGMQEGDVILSVKRNHFLIINRVIFLCVDVYSIIITYILQYHKQ